MEALLWILQLGGILSIWITAVGSLLALVFFVGWFLWRMLGIKRL